MRSPASVPPRTQGRSSAPEMNVFRLIFAIAAWELISLPAVAAPEYWVTDLGTLGGDASAALGINDRGQVVGWSQDSDGRTQAFVWQNGTMTGLGFLPGGTTSVANAIGDQGQIAGYSYVSATNFHAFLRAGDGLTDLGTLSGPNSNGRAINNAGEVSGSSRHDPATGDNSSFLWRSNQMIRIPSYGGASSCDGYGINQEGGVAGITYVFTPNPRWWAYVWDDANGNLADDAGEMKLLGTLGAKNSVGEGSGAYDLNDVGQAVGWTSVSSSYYPRHGFLVTASNGIWKLPNPLSELDPTNVLMRDLGVLGGPTNNSWARSVNNRSWVVGRADMPSSLDQAFLWRDGVMTNLNDLIPPDSGWILTNAACINEQNEIVGSGFFNGQPRAFLLRQDGRITGIEPIGGTEMLVFTNGWNEIVTQEVYRLESHVIRWAGIWNTNAGATDVFTVEHCDFLHPGTWVPFAPTSQWPIVDHFWSNRFFGDADKAFFRVRATEAGENVSPPTKRSGTSPLSPGPVRRSIPRSDRPPAAAPRRAP